MKTLDYIDEIKKKFDCSDYKVSKLLGVSHQTIGQYRNKGVTFSDSTALKAAELLGIPGEIAILDINCERAKKQGNKEVLQIWKGLSKKLAGTAAAVALAVSIAGPLKMQAESFNITKFMLLFDYNIHYAAFFKSLNLWKLCLGIYARLMQLGLHPTRIRSNPNRLAFPNAIA